MIRTRLAPGLLALVAMLTAPLFQAAAQEDSSGMGPTFKEGDIITYEQVDALRPYLPEEFWTTGTSSSTRACSSRSVPSTATTRRPRPT